MNKVLHLTYASSLTNLCEVNSSFDTGILRIAYAGQNRNGSYIDKETFEKCIKTIFNCPIVCNYDRETDTLGGHDMEPIRDSNGDLKLVNITTPVGCIPESAKIFWDTVEEDDGSIHEYLCAEALLWKRQEAYQKIKRDGCTAQSMEITVKDGEMVDGVYEIYDFEFTAFALISVEPCFQSAALEFSKQDFKQQLAQMMLEIKESFSVVNSSLKVDINTKNYSTEEGGERTLDEKMNLIAKYGIDKDQIDFSIEDITIDDLEQKLKSYTEASNTRSDISENAPTDETADSKTDTGTDEIFKLESNFMDELIRVLESETIQYEWGECVRYWFIDYDKDINTVYCWDAEDLLLCGFTYTVSGDSVTINYADKKRKKYEIVDFDEGEQASPVAQVFEMLKNKIRSNTELEAKYRTAADTIARMETELSELRRFKADAEEANIRSAKEEVFARFDDLIGIEAFEALKENRDRYDIETLEEKCFAIRGRNSVVKFAAEQKSHKLKIAKEGMEKAPYGGLFEQYGVDAGK